MPDLGGDGTAGRDDGSGSSSGGGSSGGGGGGGGGGNDNGGTDGGGETFGPSLSDIAGFDVNAGTNDDFEGVGSNEVAGPPSPGFDETDAPQDTYRKYFDPDTIYGPPDPLNEDAVNAARGGFLTNSSGFFGFREKLVDDPENPDKVKAEIQFDPVAAIGDVLGTIASGLTGGLAGIAVGRLVSNGINVATGNKSFDEAKRDLFDVPGFDLFEHFDLEPGSGNNNFTDVDGASLPDDLPQAQAAFLASIAGGNGGGIATPDQAAGDSGAINPGGVGRNDDAGSDISAIQLVRGETGGKSILPLLIGAAVAASAV